MIKCLDAYIPGSSNERFVVPFFNVNRTFRGRKNFMQNQMQISFVETVDMTSSAAIRQWLEYIVGTNTGNSQGYISSYAVTPTISVYDTTGSVSDTIQLYRCYPDDLQAVALSTATTQQMLIQATFSFDYVIYGNTAVT